MNLREVKEVVFYVITRFNYHRIKYNVYNAKTGSTYIRVGKDRIRISDHPGEYDDYNFIIRTDCLHPVKIKSKTAVSAENVDSVIDFLIDKYKARNKEWESLKTILKGHGLTVDTIKKLDIKVLYGIIQHNEHGGNNPSRKECVDIITLNPSLIIDYYKDYGESE